LAAVVDVVDVVVLVVVEVVDVVLPQPVTNIALMMIIASVKINSLFMIGIISYLLDLPN